jgi:hypothetical protein
MYFFVSEGEDLSAFVELQIQLTLQYAPCGSLSRASMQ